MLEHLIHDDTDRISNDSIKPKPFSNVNRPWSNLNPNSSKYYVPLNLNLIHKPQSANPINGHVRRRTSYYIPNNTSNQYESTWIL